jgi:Zn-finger nucleic acid-binding protein
MADTTNIIKCPACGKVMEKIYIPDAGVNIDICLDGCGGIFFDNRELEKFDGKNENIDKLIKSIDGKEFIPVNDNELRLCPVCGAAMLKMGAAEGTVQIDVCQACGGKFLDNGELQKIRKYRNDNQKFDGIIGDLVEIAYANKYGEANQNSGRIFFEKLAKKYM